MAFASLLASPAPTAASCMPFPPMDEAIAEGEVVFTGTVVGLSNLDRTAVLAVGEIWKGPDLPTEVQVLGGPEGEMMTSVDVIWQRGVRYLVIANGNGGVLETTSCRTMRWSDEFAANRPTDARTPTASASGTDAGLPIGVLGVAAVVVGFAGVSLLLFRRAR